MVSSSSPFRSRRELILLICSDRYLEGIAGNWQPKKVTASASTGTATDLGIADGCEDTISLLVDWESADNPKKRGTAVYTSSWTAPIGCESKARIGLNLNAALIVCRACSHSGSALGAALPLHGIEGRGARQPVSSWIQRHCECWCSSLRVSADLSTHSPRSDRRQRNKRHQRLLHDVCSGRGGIFPGQLE